ncbi:DUF4349 domain-containing protein [Nonomuraea rhizosphaerae]|uniref:DUF4349 domain-containing protein n=1 Tax=Nonomuraea rhizosphaerae TaxID=2665663 RepID=UPI001C5F3042|nr:DUF4349 domain-containing protein [Nonomuraea rhizosphaerae]
MERFRYGAALTAVCVTLLLAGCGGGGESMSGAAAPAAAPEMADGQSRAAADQATDSDAARTQAVPQEAKSDNLASKVKVVQQDRQVIYTASMTVRAKEVTGAGLQAKQIVTAAGGYLSKEESNSAEGSEASAMLEFKIPPARYNEVLAALGKNLGKQLSVQQGTQDVTMQVADVNSRLKSAQESLESLRTLLKKADTIGQVLQVEREISTREADLESLQAQQKELAAQTGMATLTLRLVGPVTVVEEPSDEPAGFVGGLKTGWEALVSFAKVAATVIGVLLPWLAMAVPLVALVVFLARRRRPAVVPPDPAETQAS